MSCTPPIRTIQTPTMTVFSRGTAGDGKSDLFVFTPDSIEGVAPLLFGLRVTITVENATAAFKSQAVFQTTSDGKTWDNPVALDTAAVAGNRVFTTNWSNAPNSFKRGVRVGVFASQDAVDTVQMARVSLAIDFQMVG